MTRSQVATGETTEGGIEPVLSVRSLRKAYNVGRPNEKLAIADVSFDVAKGEFVCVVGPSGAGKTTMLRCLSGLLSPTTVRSGSRARSCRRCRTGSASSSRTTAARCSRG